MSAVITSEILQEHCLWLEENLENTDCPNCEEHLNLAIILAAEALHIAKRNKAMADASAGYHLKVGLHGKT